MYICWLRKYMTVKIQDRPNDMRPIKRSKNRKGEKKMKNLFRVSDTLKELVLGILMFGLLIWGAGICFVKDKIFFSSGFWLGILLACAVAWHMWWSLEKGMDLGDGATKYMLAQNMIRYGVIVIAYGIICVTGIGNPIASFIGIMGLKAGAYLQPFTHNVLTKLKRR